MENSTSNAVKPQRSREGNLNPMWGKQQSLDTKKKISNTQKKRYEAIRKQLQKEETKQAIGRTDKVARMDLLNQCLHKDTIGFDSVEQAHNFVAIMLENEGTSYLQRIVKEELNKFLNERERGNKHV
ncbi:NUMOD3 domain-containing DNA-binding protein [Bacteroides sp. UBA939]|uniref:NUMOD3 domain-containing DNA-binding protein n=1 Tax=Bacteroides sp. UBA939 TaxID=1946092 RepID=UPI0025C49B11|nr:NUMOD3 domain-containing DNA-binding protein [Bacteroides sp. UBA939]